jgi:hypothetical protein
LQHVLQKVFVTCPILVLPGGKAALTGIKMHLEPVR